MRGPDNARRPALESDRFLPRTWRADLMGVYRYARLVDDIGDGDLAAGGADARYLGVPRPGRGRLRMLDAFETASDTP